MYMRSNIYMANFWDLFTHSYSSATDSWNYAKTQKVQHILYMASVKDAVGILSYSPSPRGYEGWLRPTHNFSLLRRIALGQMRHAFPGNYCPPHPYPNLPVDLVCMKIQKTGHLS